eukprot:3830156-Prymnesium_polylepis.1
MMGCLAGMLSRNGVYRGVSRSTHVIKSAPVVRALKEPFLKFSPATQPIETIVSLTARPHRCRWRVTHARWTDVQKQSVRPPCNVSARVTDVARVTRN